MIKDVKVTKGMVADALIDAWQKDFKLGYALVSVFYGIDCDRSVKVNPDDWGLMQKKCGLKYAPSYLSVRVWLADRMVNASDALFSGNVELARKWIISGKDKARINGEFERDLSKVKYAEKSAIANRRVKLRELDKRHDWATCK